MKYSGLLLIAGLLVGCDDGPKRFRLSSGKEVVCRMSWYTGSSMHLTACADGHEYQAQINVEVIP
jgi:hypothetical protein